MQPSCPHPTPSPQTLPMASFFRNSFFTSLFSCFSSSSSSSFLPSQGRNGGCILSCRHSVSIPSSAIIGGPFLPLRGKEGGGGSEGGGKPHTRLGKAQLCQHEMVSWEFGGGLEDEEIFRHGGMDSLLSPPRERLRQSQRGFPSSVATL